MMESKSQFFCICPLGFEDILEREILEVMAYLLDKNALPSYEEFSLEKLKGGVLVQTNLVTGLQLNFWLKTPVRILLRYAEFKCRDFPTLFQKISKLNWKQIGEFKKINVEVSCKESRLMHHGRIEDTVNKAIPLKSDSKFELSVYVRLDNDNCTISLDTSGEPLFKRGYKTHTTEAPLRENLAAGLLRFMMQDSAFASLKDVTLLDPMAGSGTFITEAALMLNSNSSRAFAFQNWSMTPKLLKLHELTKNYQIPQYEPFKNLIVQDISQEVVEVLKQNLNSAGLQVKVQVQVKDFFKTQNLQIQNLWLIMNPPYNERIKIDFTYEDLLSHALSVIQPAKLGIIIPKTQFKKKFLNLNPDYQCHWIDFKNGGIEVSFYCFNKRAS